MRSYQELTTMHDFKNMEDECIFVLKKVLLDRSKLDFKCGKIIKSIFQAKYLMKSN